MDLQEYLRQETRLRPGIHLHDGVWWKRTSPGCCQPLYPLQEIAPGSARPSSVRSFVRYSHVVPEAESGSCLKTRTRLLIQGENLKNYSLQNLADRKRRQAINKAVRGGFKTALIPDLEKHRRDLHEIYISNAARNRHGLSAQWYVEHEAEWWRNLVREFALPGREWFGTFLGEKLVAFLYACMVDTTSTWLVSKSHKDYLVSNPNDLLLFDAILHYQNNAACRRIDTGWAIPVPPTIDWRKKTLGFEPTEIPVFEKTNRWVIGMVRSALFLAKPLLDSVAPDANRGLLFKARTIQKRLEDSGGDT